MTDICTFLIIARKHKRVNLYCDNTTDNMNKVIATTASVTGMVASMVSPASAAGREKTKGTDKPNIVLIIGDDCRMRDLGCYGNVYSKTPNIDRLASEGMRFERFFQATAMSSPTRQCLLTGLYPVHSGAYPNHTFINPDVRTLPSYLIDCGYRVATQGKGKGKKQVYGIHTTRGIINGFEHYGIRSVRTDRYLYIRNLTPETEFRCAAFNDSFFKSLTEIADTNEFAALQIRRYSKRPGEELYDVRKDPFQQHNLAADPASARTLKKMRKLLDKWMENQGDKGQETEMDAFNHIASKMHVK